jgi:hypothetical protein
MERTNGMKQNKILEDIKKNWQEIEKENLCEEWRADFSSTDL